MLALDENLSSITLDEGLSKDLEQRFGANGLQRARVVSCPDLPVSTDERSDFIHQCLGEVAARELEPLLQIVDVLGVGSGRAVGYTADAYARTHAQRGYATWPRRMHIVPLTGHICAGAWAPSRVTLSDRKPYYDAWYAADKLSQVCWSSTVHRIELPFVLPDQFLPEIRDVHGLRKAKSAQDFIEDNRLPIALSSWQREEAFRLHEVRPQLCLVGVGVLGFGHQLVRGINEEEVEPIRRELRQLLSMVDSERYVVGDVCNQLFAAKPTAIGIPRACDLVDEINNHLLTITRQHFDYVDTLVMVAGGVEKANVIREVLEWPMRAARRLYVDAACAQAILSENAT